MTESGGSVALRVLGQSRIGKVLIQWTPPTTRGASRFHNLNHTKARTACHNYDRGIDGVHGHGFQLSMARKPSGECRRERTVSSVRQRNQCGPRALISQFPELPLFRGGTPAKRCRELSRGSLSSEDDPSTAETQQRVHGPVELLSSDPAGLWFTPKGLRQPDGTPHPTAS